MILGRMSGLAQLAIALAVVFAVNLLPAFGPPTWAVLVFFSLDFDLPAVPLVLGGALAAAGGRFVLANGARRLRPRLARARLERLDRAEAALGADRRRTAAGLALFALSPVPSGQLFTAAGLMTVPLLPLTAVFFAGRLVSYSIYVGVASVAEKSLGGLVLDALTSPLGMVLQVAMLVALAVLLGGFKPEERLGGQAPRPDDGNPPSDRRRFADGGPEERT
ncbi:MAG TPA: hypothetical protein VFP21_05460 [Solirubrobacterales bacterium]|nr:hypothetical protein [Solirubrobacterales bacterium]